MFFDLNVALPAPALLKAKQANDLVFSPTQVAAIESRIDMLVHLGYTVLALNQTVQTRVDSRTHVNWLQSLLPKLRKRHGIAILKRVTVILDEESDKGNGINAQNAALLANYDILALHPTTAPSLAHACLTHTAPSPHTTHIIALPLSLPRLPFHLKHTLIRTALKNGAAFEIPYAGALSPESDRRNWWAGARELVRVTNGKSILLSGAATENKDLRAPRDAANLVTLLGIPQNLSHDAITQTPKSVTLRAQSRKTYRAVLSEPKLVLPMLPSPHPSEADSELPQHGEGETGEVGGSVHQQGQQRQDSPPRPPSLHLESTMTQSASTASSALVSPTSASAPAIAQQEQVGTGGSSMLGSGTGAVAASQQEASKQQVHRQQQQQAVQKEKKRRREDANREKERGGNGEGERKKKRRR